MKKICIILMAIVLSSAIAGCSSNNNPENSNGGSSKGNKPTLTFGMTSWTSTVPPTKVAEKILKNMGYKVEEKNAEPGAIYAGLSNDSIDVFMDSWYPNQKQYIKKFSDSIESVAISYKNANSGMVVPKYMKNIHDVGDLKGKEGMVDHKMYGIDPGDPAMDNMKKVIKAYNLDIHLVTASESAMLAQAKKKIAKKKPVLFYGWRPHTMFEKFNLKILTNKKAPDHLFSGSSIHVIVPKKLKKKAPKAYKFLSNWSISMEDVENMMVKIDKGKDPDAVAKTWIDHHQKKVNKMTGKK